MEKKNIIDTLKMLLLPNLKILKNRKFIIAVIVLFTLSVIGNLIDNQIPQQTTEQQNQPTPDIHTITKDKFNGIWAFSVNEVKVYNVPVAKNSTLTGGKVVIDGNIYAVTRNLTDLEFLPDKYWQDGSSHIYEPTGEKVCEGDSIFIDDECKMSLSDIVSYIDKLPIEK